MFSLPSVFICNQFGYTACCHWEMVFLPSNCCPARSCRAVVGWACSALKGDIVVGRKTGRAALHFSYPHTHKYGRNPPTLVEQFAAPLPSPFPNLAGCTGHHWFWTCVVYFVIFYCLSQITSSGSIQYIVQLWLHQW